MKIVGLCLLLVGFCSLAFFAGQKFPLKLRSENLKVVFADEKGLPDIPAAQQVLALVYADPCIDAEVAFFAKDFRVVGFPGSKHDRSAMKMIPLTNDYIRHPSQEQINQIAGRYAAAYNKRMGELREWEKQNGTPPKAATVTTPSK